MENTLDELQYPCIRKDTADTGLVVLFFDRVDGIVLDGGTTQYVPGHQSDGWNYADDLTEWFTPSDEEILRLLNVRGY